MSKGWTEEKDPRDDVAIKHREAALKGKQGKKVKSPFAGYKGIDKAIAEMLTENTGMNVLDSGGESDRLWQQNQGRDFKKEDATQIEVWEKSNEVIVTFNLFHFLTTYLELDDNCKKLQKRFDKFAQSPEQEDEPWLISMEEFSEQVHDPSVYGFFGSDNTSNYDNVLAGVIQFVSFGYEDVMYMLLQTHNGADTRGGYSEPRIFKVPDPEYLVLAQNAVYASTDRFAWDSDDAGFSWHGSVSYNDEEEIPELEFDVRDDKAYLKGTDDEVTFGIMESY